VFGILYISLGLSLTIASIDSTNDSLIEVSVYIFGLEVSRDCI